MDILAVNNLSTMLQYCQENLSWGIDLNDFEDIDDVSFDIDYIEMGVKPEAAIKIQDIKQVRPISADQPWGIFSIELESNRIEIAIIRKIVSKLVNSSRAKEYKTWDLNNLLFFCFWGEKAYRTLGIIVFEQNEKSLPTIKPIYCCPRIEDKKILEEFENKLQCLSWPSDTKNTDLWLTTWRKAFHSSYGKVIKDSRLLTSHLASTALKIANNIDRALDIENDNGAIHQLFKRFNKAMNVEITRKKFVDMYAQTIVFGIFSACCLNPNNSPFTPQTALECIPNTNPLLKDLLKECYLIDSALQFDELEIQDLISLLNNTDIKAIMSDFNRQTSNGKEDPIIYFYENFLDLYEKEQKKRNGVYYTPMPVVDFMVRAVSHFLKTQYLCEHGFLNDCVSVLDPAAGTGTFLRKIILEIYDEYNKADIPISWSNYVREYLLPRLFAFEFMMAPYAVAHMKLAMVLKETAYDFLSNDRLQVYLSNALEKNDALDRELNFFDPLLRETIKANKIKRSSIKVIIGNPPYRTNSENKGDWIMRLMDDYKKEPMTDKKLNERNPKVINDDYVKFIRFAQDIVSNQSDAIIAYINPHSYIDNLTFRGMRWQLLKNFDEIFIVDLHGNIMSREVLDTVERDENVFDILQGVSINFFVKNTQKKHSVARVYYADICGSRKTKYEYLRTTDFENISWQELKPESPNFFFKPQNNSFSDTYNSGFSVSALFPIQIGGIKTHDDDNLISIVPFDSPYDELYEYRPFDMRHINYDLTKVVRHRYEVMKHFIGHKNLGLVIDRQVVNDNWSHVQVVEHLIDNRLHYSRKGIPIVCPLYLFDGDDCRPNVDFHIIKSIEEGTGLKFSPIKTDDVNIFIPVDLLDYCYAILNSSKYREKYQQLLAIDFPKVPYPHSADYFKQMCLYGAMLRNYHLQKSVIKNSLNIEFLGDGDNVVTKIEFKHQRLYINKTQYFSNLSEQLVDFCYGGYHGLQKWFKDRLHTTLTKNEITHIIDIYNIFQQTMKIVSEIDATILL